MTTATQKRAPSTHATSLYEGEVVEESDLGSIRRITADNFPILQGMSIKRVLISPGRCALRTGTPMPTSSPTASRDLTGIGARHGQPVLVV